MINQNEDKFWFACKSIHGDIWIEGPFNTREQALVARENAKLEVVFPAVVGTVFVAATKEEALERASLFIGG